MTHLKTNIAKINYLYKKGFAKSMLSKLDDKKLHELYIKTEKEKKKNVR